jgi:beta-glucosidase
MRIGVATAATQIEGGDTGNQWYEWSLQPGRVADGSSPLRTTDHWNRWREDTDLLSSLGLTLYRMGVEWSRLEPRRGRFDPEALEHYREELAALREKGVEPLVTLHHFSNPTWFERAGGWTASDAVDTWLRFVRHVVEGLGDLVTEWCTVNEPNVYATGGYLFGEMPPGGTGDWVGLRRVLRNLAVAHCRAYHVVHEVQPGPGTRVGFAHHLRVFEPLDPGNPVHRRLSRLSEHLFQDVLSDAMLGGRFSRLLGGQPRDVRPGPHYDYLGVNYYSRTAVSRLADGTFPGQPVNDLGWEIHPQGLVDVIRALHARYPGPVWVTENGVCDASDAYRARFLHDHLGALAGSGLPVERYYHWCFVDNWEWSEGDVPRFGIVHLDHRSQERTVKDSGRFLAEAARRGEVTEEMYEKYVAGQEYPRG